MKISPSILDANFGDMQAELASIATADRIHLDVMDGQYVPNLSFGVPVLKKLKFPVPTEAHLMTLNPENFVADFVDLGCETITFHIEATGLPRAIALLDDLKKMGVRPGITIDGFTDPDWITDEILTRAEQVLVMSVKSGFGGQKFMESALLKVEDLRARGYQGEIEVDGGVTAENITEIADAGVDIAVVGSFLMKLPAAERVAMIREMQL